MKKIDKSTWRRREIYDFFCASAQPYYSMTFTVDVTNVYRFAKAHSVSFYYAMCHLVTRAVNEVEAFRYLTRDGEIYLLDRRTPSFTDIKKGDDLFYIVTLPMEDDILSFCARAAEKSSKQDFFIDMSSESDELIYLSCAPTLNITALTNEHDGRPDDAIPRIAWGKYTEVDGRKQLGLSIEVNHRFIDGVHIGLFAQALERFIDQL